MVFTEVRRLSHQIMLISRIEVTNTAVYEVTMKVPKVQENIEMECDEQRKIPAFYRCRKGLGHH